MILSPLLMILICLFLLAVEAFFSGSEIALLSADKLQLKSMAKAGNKRAKLALEMALHPERILSATLLMTSLCVITLSTLITLFFIQRKSEHFELWSILITSPLIVILGELLPKTIFQKHATQIAPRVSLAVYGIFWALFPITKTVSSYTFQLSRMLGPIEELLTGKKANTRDNLRSLLAYGKRETTIKTSERKMIKRIFEFRDTEAKHALIPLVQIDAIEETATVREALVKFEEHKHSRMPVYANRIDNIIGIIELRDLFHVTQLDQPLRGYLSAAHYVAETQSLDDLLKEMRSEDLEMVVVVDEYGGAVGILTFEDIIEEIVGEIQDEYDNENHSIRELSPMKWVIQARTEVNQINEALGLELPEGDYETLGGFLLQQFARIPSSGDELYFNTPSCHVKFTIRKASERQVEVIYVEKLDDLTKDQ